MAEMEPSIRDLRKKFQGVPGHTLGIFYTNHGSVLSMVFLATATHPNEPIPWFHNLNDLHGRQLASALALLSHTWIPSYLTIAEFRELGAEMEGHLKPLSEHLYQKAHAARSTKVVVLENSGFIFLNPDGIIGTAPALLLAKEMHRRGRGKWQL